jgi:hypothetical protein
MKNPAGVIGKYEVDYPPAAVQESVHGNDRLGMFGMPAVPTRSQARV